VAEGCEICARLANLTPDYPYFIAELPSGYAVLGDNQQIPGYTLFLSRICAPELHELPREQRAAFLHDMSRVAEAMFRAFQPRKLNYELLGNSVAHLHWHLFPRYEDDPNPQWPVWNNEAWRNAPRRTPSEPERLAVMRESVRGELRALGA
jgi:diadenosine tetraphosphate (Ap4A) HIT family hydrolase